MDRCRKRRRIFEQWAVRALDLKQKDTPMEGMVRLSFYLFAAASIAVAAAWVSYVVYGVGFIRLRRTALATSAGTTVSGMIRNSCQIAAWMS